MAERELAFLSELSLPPMELLDPGLGNLLGAEQFEFGLLSTTGLPLQMEDGLAAGQDDGMITPLFGDADLAGWIEGVCNPSHLLLDTDDVHHHQLEDKSYSIIVDQATTAKQAHSNQKLDMVPMRGSWGGCGQRKSRNKSASWKAAETSHLFGFLKPSASGDVNFGTRKKYSHWTPHEVEKLVDGLDEHGVGNWVKIKKTYFKTSPRTAMHLKDKWRGLCAACGLQVGSKQKVKAQAATREMLKGLENKIREIARKHNALED
ncbi:unnamed protein product [Urochloa decumbens]|uniref:Myb-like domain-containing protein n=1 Tax=Urochloa decumbens TaxID=240449 RepID=A0ABC8XG90_9POAL